MEVKDLIMHLMSNYELDHDLHVSKHLSKTALDSRVYAEERVTININRRPATDEELNRFKKNMNQMGVHIE